MAKKKPEVTPRSQIKRVLAQLFLRSRERAAAMKRDKYTCQTCGVKQSRKRGEEVFVEEHHIDGVDWQFLIDEIYRVLLVPPNRLTTECRKCHDLEKKP